ncbi:MAG TPA: hypothetical protein VFQ68_19255 [Streptosporangiaceae bacterium]|nr:hypothetical protein [Streptosporangiaceae bacterium]
MGIKEILVGLFHGRSGKDGIWDFLGKWATGRSQVKLEQVHNDGTQKLIPLLEPGTVVIERGRGWSREIRVPERSQSGVLLTAVTSLPTTPPLPAGELGPARRNELEPGRRDEPGPASPDEAEPAPRQAQGSADES